MTAGHVAVTFPKKPSLLLETRASLTRRISITTGIRLTPAVYEVSIIGLQSGGRGRYPSRRRVFTCRRPQEEDGCAKKILSSLMRRRIGGP